MKTMGYLAVVFLHYALLDSFEAQGHVDMINA